MATSLQYESDRAPFVGASPYGPLDQLLEGFEALLTDIPEALHASVHEGGISIAQHVDRALSSIDAFAAALSTSRLSSRPARIANADDVQDRLGRVRRLRDALRRSPALPSAHVVRVDLRSRRAELDEQLWSSLDVELGFVINQALDAQRVIASHLQAVGARPPRGFATMESLPLRARSSSSPTMALWSLLDELETVIVRTPPQVYRARFAPEVSGSIGEHVRHCLDHFGALLAADPSAVLSYDSRHRGTAVETDPEAAVRRIESLKRGCIGWAARPLDQPIQVSSMVSPDGQVIVGWSTLARELAFVVSHTIHHQALIGVLLAIHGEDVPDRFGHSPSTPRQH